jgi:hypothetical protein
VVSFLVHSSLETSVTVTAAAFYKRTQRSKVTNYLAPHAGSQLDLFSLTTTKHERLQVMFS